MTRQQQIREALERRSLWPLTAGSLPDGVHKEIAAELGVTRSCIVVTVQVMRREQRQRDALAKAEAALEEALAVIRGLKGDGDAE